MSMKKKVKALKELMTVMEDKMEILEAEPEERKIANPPEPLKAKHLIIHEQPKILYFDIETTDLSGSFGELLMMGYRWHHEDEYHIVHIYDFEGWDELPIERRDLYLVQHVAEIIAEADVLVGHYSLRFDHRFVQTRCLVHGLAPIPDTAHVDTWAIAKYQLKVNNNRLATLAKTFGCDNEKAELPWWVWRRSKAHDVEALKLMSEYCLQDVRTQYDVTQKLLPIAKKMPNWNLLTGESKLRCPGCGSYHIQKRGKTHTKVNTYQRYQCMDCGHWMRGRHSLTDKDTERVMY